MRLKIAAGLAILGTVSGVAALVIFAGDKPMPSNTVQSPPNNAVRMLAAENFAESQRGEKQILEERAELISQLSAIISDPQNHVRRPHCVKKAMSCLGELRALEGIEVLVIYIGFPHVHHPDAGEYPGPAGEGGDLNKTIEQLLPAVPALISIGEPCIDEVINKFSTTDNVLEATACETVLKKLSQRPSVRAKLERALQRTKTPKRKRLEKVLKVLDVQPASQNK